MRSSQLLSLMAVLVFISCISLPNIAIADMEGRMPFSHVQYNSPGLDNSGPVSVSAFQNKDGIFKLKVSAFGRDYVLAKSKLHLIDGYIFNAVGLSYSRGYLKTGGRTVYVSLYQVFSTSARAVAMVVIRERGAAQVIILKNETD